MASNKVPVDVDNLIISHANITLAINISEVCPICLGDFVTNKNIVVPDCGHSMHINCFSSLLSYKFIDCSICKEQIIDEPELSVSDIQTRSHYSGQVPPRPVHTVYPSDYDRVIVGDGTGMSPWG